jgi:hypothetical protein
MAYLRDWGRSASSRRLHDHAGRLAPLARIDVGISHAVLPPQNDRRRYAALSAANPHGRPGHHPNFVHCPSETTSTEPSTTLMAVCSSMA